MLAIDTSLDHPSRRQLNDEVHARPPDSIQTPQLVTYLARVPKRAIDDPVARHVLDDLLKLFAVEPPDAEINHFTATLDDLRLRWERHTEYTRYTFSTPADANQPFAGDSVSGIPAEWLQNMRSEILVGVKASVVDESAVGDSIADLSKQYFDGNILIGSEVADHYAIALTDLRIHGDGFSRLLLINHGMSAAQTGRVLQRLLEIETYRMMALLALPTARRLGPQLDADERELAEIAQALVDAESQQEQALLDRLTRLSATSQNRRLGSNYRFAAADAYYDIVLQRINELRETRIPGLQTFEEFTTRRLAPAVKTYRAVSNRQQSILEQMARATKLLSTRIDIARQEQNQALLASMDRRGKAQLRLSATVEGLSVAAVTYYVVGLVGTLTEGIAGAGVPLNKDIVMGASIPVVAAIAFALIRRLRRKISREEAG